MTARCSVLVVDDHDDSRELLASVLSLRGHRVVVAASGVEALRLVHEERPPVVLLDLALPDIDGWEVARRVKADPVLRHITIFAVTAHAFRSATQAALSAGCERVFTKPLNLDDVTAAVDRVLRTQVVSDLQERRT